MIICAHFYTPINHGIRRNLKESTETTETLGIPLGIHGFNTPETHRIPSESLNKGYKVSAASNVF